MPAIGDDDEGRVIAQPPDREPRYVASVIAAVVGLTRRDDLPIPARDPHLRDVIFDSPQQSSGEKSGLRVFEQGGGSVADETLFGRPPGVRSWPARLDAARRPWPCRCTWDLAHNRR